MLDDIYSRSGYNIAINIGKTAGQTVMHLHVHLISRYKGDVEEPRGGVKERKVALTVYKDTNQITLTPLGLKFVKACIK